MKQLATLLLLVLLSITACAPGSYEKLVYSADDLAFNWNNANIYFLLTDRFKNSSIDNDISFERKFNTAINRGFQGGDLAGITKKIEEGYFDALGITAIWMTPFFEQIHGAVDEGTGLTTAYHGYWTKDWTALDPNFGTEDDLEMLVKTAHEHGIRIVMDVIINHTGPVTELDPQWPIEWVRTGPPCTYKGYSSTVKCTLVENLPDIRTESEENIALPPQLLEKWEAEGRLEEELAELDAFFEETNYPRAPKYYIIKWLTDYIKKYGINAYRLDTAKHTEKEVWTELRKSADRAYASWKIDHPDSFVENDPFYMVGEVYNYGISAGRFFSYGDTTVDFFSAGINHLLNFEFKWDARNNYEDIFSKYSGLLQDELKGQGVLNYLSSHDDGDPFDALRQKPFEAATKLLLCPGASQIYYGDETSRVLTAEGAIGDANLRSFMNWEQLDKDVEIGNTSSKKVLTHYQKLGQFRQKHPAVGAGIHEKISEDPYIFKRSYTSENKQDIVIVALDITTNHISIPVNDIFPEGTKLLDSYSGKIITVKDGLASIDGTEGIVLLGTY